MFIWLFSQACAGLHVGEELAHVEVVDGGHLQHVAPAVLVDVAEVARALREDRLLELEVVVVTLEVAVDAREGVVDLGVGVGLDAHLDGHAAAQHVVEVVLLGVGVHRRHARGHGHALGQVGADLLGGGAHGGGVALLAQLGHDDVGEDVLRGGVADDERDGLRLARLELERGRGEGRGRARGDALRLLEDVGERGAARRVLRREELARDAERGVGAEEQLLVADDRQQRVVALGVDVGVVLDVGQREVALLDEGHVGRVGGDGDQVEEGLRVVLDEVEHLHPALEGAPHGGHLQHADARRLELGEAVDDLELDVVVALVCVGHAADHRREHLVDRGDVERVGADAGGGVDLLDLHLVVAHHHLAVGRGLRVGVARRHEGLRLEARARGARALEERAEADEGRHLVGLLRGLEEGDAAVLVLHAEGGHALPAVDVEGPHGNAPLAADAGQEGGLRDEMSAAE
eukprot:scaffold11018_cov64-Phaeocystis_antarctica.AAC.5